MAKNDFISKRNERDQAFFDAGERIGMQNMWDYVQLCLRDPVVVGKEQDEQTSLFDMLEGAG